MGLIEYISSDFQKMLYDMSVFVGDTGPQMITFLVFLLISYFFSIFLGWSVKKMLYPLNLDKHFRKQALTDALGFFSISRIAGFLVTWYVFLTLLGHVLQLLELPNLVQPVVMIILWLPNLLVAISAILVGLILVDYVFFRYISSRNRVVLLSSHLSKAILICIVVIISLEQLGVTSFLINGLIFTTLGVFLAAISITLGTGLGIYLKDDFRPFVKKVLGTIR